VSDTKDRKHLNAYVVADRNGRSFWSKIGAAFHNADGGMTLLLDAYPAQGNRIVVREPKPWEGRPANEHGNGAHPPGNMETP
jgi:hypothetical protein